ncbi:MAG: cytochrome c oxidase assembly protein [Candidatus Baltobacteraceae bacterium]
MIAVACIAVLLGWYLWAHRLYHRKFPGKAAPPARVFFFLLGSLVLMAALGPPLDSLSERSFTFHMTQHIGLTMIAPPLLLLGAPLLYILGTLPRRLARSFSRMLRSWPITTVFSPVTAWLLFVAVMWISHFSPLYNSALEDWRVHLFEHALYFWTAIFFWSAVVQTGFIPYRLSFPARMLFVFLAIPQGAFLGLALYQTRYVLFAHYANGQTLAATLADQHNGGAVMWIAGGMTFFTAFMLTAGMWAVREQPPRLATASRGPGF